jgi:hypothetical protein
MKKGEPMKYLRPTVLLLVISLFCVDMLSACQRSSTSQNTTPQRSPTSSSLADQIMQHALHAPLQDTSYTIYGTNSTTIPIGTGQYTAHPQRVEEIYPDKTYSGAQDIIIFADGYEYSSTQNIADLLGHATPWMKNVDPITGGYAHFLTDYSLFFAPRLIGIESVNHRQAYHIHDSVLDSIYDARKSTDIWFDQTTYFPLKRVEVSLETYSRTTTILFTAWNTGVVINVPNA